MFLKAKNPDIQIVGLQPKDGNIPGIRRAGRGGLGVCLGGMRFNSGRAVDGERETLVS